MVSFVIVINQQRRRVPESGCMEKLFLIPISNRLVETNMFVVFFFLFAVPDQLCVTLALAAAVVRAFFTDGCHLAGQQ